MRIPIIIFVLTAFSRLSIAQPKPEKPNYASIKIKTADPQSPCYYPVLLKRMNANDTTLTNDDFRHLYLGYLFQPQYNPYFRSTQEEALLEFYKSNELKPSDYDKVVDLAEKSFAEFPFDLRPMNFAAYVQHLKGNEAASKKLLFRFNHIISAIVSTGDGITCESGWHVISVSHEYTLLSLLRLRSASQGLRGECDFMEVAENPKNIKGLYFNIAELLEKESALLGGTKKD